MAASPVLPPTISSSATAVARSSSGYRSPQATFRPIPAATAARWVGPGACQPDAAPTPVDATPALVDAAPTPIDAAPGDLTLTVVLDGAGVGDVKSVPSGIACAPQCAEAFPANISVTLTAAPHVGAYFAGWSEPTCGMALSCTVAITASLAVVAKFEVMP